jgi:MFS family permease
MKVDRSTASSRSATASSRSSMASSRTSSHPIGPLLLAIFMRALPLTMFGPLLPGIARSLGAGLAEVGWIVATYATGSLVAQPVMGRLSDMRGRRTMLLWCVALFGAGSLVCALSTTLWLLVVGRIIQALGAGGIQPVVTAIVADRWPQEARGGAIGAIYAMFGIGTMAGALLGGAIVDGALWLARNVGLGSALRAEIVSFPWHLVFVVNVALAIATFAAVATLPADDLVLRKRSQGFDYAGIAFIAAFTACVMLAATASPRTAPLAVVGAVLSLVALAAWETRAKAPLFEPALFVGRGPSLVYLIALLFGVPSFSLTIYSATYFIAQFNATEAQSGIALFGLAAAYVIGAIVGGQAVRRLGPKAPLLAGLICAGVSLALLASVDSQTAVIGAMVLGGLGLGLASAPPNVLLLEYFAPERVGGATGLALMLATSGSITAPAVVSAFLHFGGGTAPVELRAAFAVGAALCGLCALAGLALQ